MRQIKTRKLGLGRDLFLRPCLGVDLVASAEGCTRLLEPLFGSLLVSCVVVFLDPAGCKALAAQQLHLSFHCHHFLILLWMANQFDTNTPQVFFSFLLVLELPACLVMRCQVLLKGHQLRYLQAWQTTRSSDSNAMYETGDQTYPLPAKNTICSMFNIKYPVSCQDN